MKERSQNVTIQSEVKGRGLFYSVIAVATFIIMAVGATFAYFTATTSSANTSLQTQSTTLKLQYISYEEAWMNADLIPADTKVVEYSFEYQSDTTINTGNEDYETMRYNTICKDDYGNSICSVYVFQVANSANSPQSVSLDVVTMTNEFANLNAMAYEIAEPVGEDTDAYKQYFPTLDEETQEQTFLNPLNGTGDPKFNDTEDASEDAVDVRNGDGIFLVPDSYNPVYVNRNGVTKTLLKYNVSENEVGPAIDRPIKVIDPKNPNDNTADIADNITIDGKGVKTFALVLYIKNIDEDQTEADAAKSFSGQVVVSSGDGKVGVSGFIGIEETTALQSGGKLDVNVETEPEPGTGA